MTRFAVGEPVTVHDRDPSWEPRKPHLRTPFYIRGKTGAVERICGDFCNPEGLAYGEDGLPKQTLYRIRFDQADVWPDYSGPAHDKVEIEIYEHWLERATP
jgi:hypothetical protein